jgi:hypothetical protein
MTRRTFFRPKVPNVQQFFMLEAFYFETIAVLRSKPLRLGFHKTSWPPEDLHLLKKYLIDF